MKTRSELHVELIAAKDALMPFGRAYNEATKKLADAILTLSCSESTRAALAIDPHDPEALEMLAGLDERPTFGAALSGWLVARREFSARLERLERARAEINELSAVEVN